LKSVNHDQLLGSLLREVSRSFYLTLRVLPRPIRSQISLAYLLARASDTIADTKAVPRSQRVSLLRNLRETGSVSVGAVADNQSLPAEKELLLRLDECFQVLAAFAPEDQQRIRELLHTIITGQIFDLERFPGETEHDLIALADDAELDRYTYMVAGCVGEFWTKMCRAHLAELECWRDGEMVELGIRFGKGLQLVNILRDVPKDLRIGRCYLPVANPAALLQPESFPAIKPVYDRWLDVAVEHLDAGWRYTLNIPVTLTRLRLACIWPIWIGLMTVARLRRGNPLDPSQRIKVSRGEVYGLILQSLLVCRSTTGLEKSYRQLRHRTVEPRS
jgi:farnesyl-diphosphate farnesyltransferase